MSTDCKNNYFYETQIECWPKSVTKKFIELRVGWMCQKRLGESGKNLGRFWAQTALLVFAFLHPFKKTQNWKL